MKSRSIPLIMAALSTSVCIATDGQPDLPPPWHSPLYAAQVPSKPRPPHALAQLPTVRAPLVSNAVADLLRMTAINLFPNAYSTSGSRDAAAPTKPDRQAAR